jgi:hypothetical protein
LDSDTVAVTGDLTGVVDAGDWFDVFISPDYRPARETSGSKPHKRSNITP